MSDSHVAVHVAEAVTFGMVIAGFFLVRRGTYRVFYRVLTVVAWGNVVLWGARQAVQGFSSPLAGATENVESWMWAIDLVLTGLVTAVFIREQGRLGRLARPWPWVAATLLLGPAVSLPVVLPSVLDARGEVDERAPVPMGAYAVLLVISLGILGSHLGLFSQTGGAFVLKAVTNPHNTYVVGSICVAFASFLPWSLPSIKNLGVRTLVVILTFMFVAVGLTVVLLMRSADRGIRSKGSSHD